MEYEWKEATTGDLVELKEGESIEGELIEIEPSSMYDESWALKLQIDGEAKAVWVNKIVVDKLKCHKIPPGTMIKLTYKGKHRNKANTRDYKEFELLYQVEQNAKV